MKYLGCMWGFELRARVGQYTRAEPGESNHCVRIDDLTFIVEISTVTQTVLAAAWPIPARLTRPQG
jgi:hypothetical protein